MAVSPSSHILVILVARIGDTLLGTPMLRALKAACPEGTLTCMAHPKRLDVLANLAFIDTLKPIDKTRAKLQGRLGKKQYDYALVYGGDEPLIKFAKRVSHHVAAFDQGDDLTNALLDSCVERPTHDIHAVDERALLANAIGIKLSQKQLAFEPTAAEANTAKERVNADKPGLRISLQVASFPTKAYRDWPVEHFESLTRQLLEAYPQVRFYIMGDGASADKANALCDTLGTHAINCTGKYPLRESAAIIAQTHLYIGVDTGPTHIAGALSVPMVGMYHPKHPGRNLMPLDHPNMEMLELATPEGKTAEEAMMADLTPHAVLQAAQRVLAKVDIP